MVNVGKYSSPMDGTVWNIPAHVTERRIYKSHLRGQKSPQPNGQTLGHMVKLKRKKNAFETSEIR